MPVMRMCPFLSAGTILVLTLLGGCDRAREPQQRPETQVIPAPAQGPSLAPELAISATGEVVLSWLEAVGDGHALRYARFENGGWSTATTVAESNRWFVNYADRPSVVPLDGQSWAAHWLALRGDYGYAYEIQVATSSDGGRTWSEPVVPHRDGTDTQHGFLRMYRAGQDIGLVWLDGRKYINEVSDDVGSTAMTLRAAILAPDRMVGDEMLIDDIVCDCCEIDVAETALGPIAVYRDRSTEEIRDIYAARRIGGVWQPGRLVHADGWEIDGCPVNGPVVEAAEHRVAVVWFTGAGNRARVQLAWSTDAGATFEAPILVDDERPLGHVGAQLLPDGDVIVSWLRMGSGSSGAELSLQRIGMTGASGPRVLIHEAEAIFAFSVPQIALYENSLLLAWTTERDNQFGIGTARVPLTAL